MRARTCPSPPVPVWKFAPCLRHESQFFVSCENLNFREYPLVYAKNCKRIQKETIQKKKKKTLLNLNKAYIIFIIHYNTTNITQSKLTMKIYDKNLVVLTTIIVIKDNYKYSNHKYPQ